MKPYLKTIIITALIFFSAQQCMAGTDTSVDINEAIELTLKNNSELRSLREEILKAEAFKVEADGTLLPSINIKGYIDQQKESQTSDGSSRYDSKEVSATLEQILYSGGEKQRHAQAV